MYMKCLPHWGTWMCISNCMQHLFQFVCCMGTCTCMIDGKYTDVHQVLRIHSNAKPLAMVNWKHKCFFAGFPLFLQSSWWSVHMLTMEAYSKKKNNWCHDYMCELGKIIIHKGGPQHLPCACTNVIHNAQGMWDPCAHNGPPRGHYLA